MDSDLTQKAIAQALAGNWQEAIKINRQLLKKNPQEPGTLNRLAKAYFEAGDLKKAKTICQRVLKIDRSNAIASKNIDRWLKLKSKKNPCNQSSPPVEFIEEPGKTKIVSLLHLGDPKTLAKLDAGDEIKLFPHRHRVSLVNQEGQYLGRLPDDLAARIRQLVKRGNTYQAFIKSAELSGVKVFLREDQKDKTLTSVNSF